MSRLVPAPDALVGKRFDVAVAKMLGISRARPRNSSKVDRRACLVVTFPNHRLCNQAKPSNSILSRNGPSLNRSHEIWQWSTKTMTS